ncbi:hypothetical protein [Proteus myxofaciens]|uniref:T-box domain-containing protein n=1 Tax=Proteus myxofaciens ATCC 19692 TaxID=1354337 RepID=A0A198G5Q3_9GAMM|nr:hypothetical protein [Proteus myxofaciens]OAT32290.1 hypothetical protein M983_1332 [Proteus myxofaciens ATCC 19692]
MLYYLYILYGPLKNTTVTLVPENYVLYLYKNKPENNKNNFPLYIPCDSDTLEATIEITLSHDKKEDNIFKVTQSSSHEEINIDLPLELETPIYINNIPIALISLNNNLPLTSFALKKIKKEHVKFKKKYKALVTLIIMLCFLFFTLNKYYAKDKKNHINSEITTNYKNYKSVNGHYCFYDNLPPEWINNKDKPEQYSYIGIAKLDTLFFEKHKKIYHITLKNNEPPKIAFIFHNNNEKKQILTNINHIFPTVCQPIIVPISIPDLLTEFNKINFIKDINYKVEEEKNGITFIFDEKIEKKNKVILDAFIKKQSTIFGRKFIFYNENRNKLQLDNKGVLQEDNGYIFIDNQHRYFPQG